MWCGPGEVTWEDYRWRVLGNQALPVCITLREPSEIAQITGNQSEWIELFSAHAEFSARWPKLGSTFARVWDVSSSQSETETRRMIAVLEWFEANPRSNLYLRQIPVPGVDTKWIERRKGLMTAFLSALQGKSAQETDFQALAGLRPLPHLVRLRVLDPRRREQTGGMGEFSAPVEELARLKWRIESIYVVENLQSGLALEDCPGRVAFVGLGNGVAALSRIPWVAEAGALFYWGDIDTHGFAILNQLRTHFPAATSRLMDERTLLGHRPLWSTEKNPHSARELPHLTAAENALYRKLREEEFGVGVRLEQERIPWTYVRDKL